MKFDTWMQTAKQGDTFVYYKGPSLAAVRHFTPSSEDARQGASAWRASVAGHVGLVQRRAGVDEKNISIFEYIAVRGSFNPPLRQSVPAPVLNGKVLAA